MSKRYSGKSFKDSSVMKKTKLTFKEKRKLKEEKKRKDEEAKVKNEKQDSYFGNSCNNNSLFSSKHI